METEFKKTKKPVNYLKREQIVLSKELKEAVEKKVLATLRTIKAHYGVDIPMPEIRYDLKSKVAGMYVHDSQNPGRPFHGKVPQHNVLRFHPIFLAENPTDYVEETVPHEVAHTAVSWIWKGIPKNKQQKKVVSHGIEWQEVMVKIGRGPGPNRSWADIVKHVYNPASLAIPPRKKYGPRKPGGKNVGEIMLKIGKLKPEELEALLLRLGLEGIAKNPPEVQAEVDALEEHLWNTPEYRKLRIPSFSGAGWALNVIKHHEEQ